MIYRQVAIDALYKEIIKRRLLGDDYDGMLDEFATEEVLKKCRPHSSGLRVLLRRCRITNMMYL